MQTPITVVDGGLAGLTAAIACAEQGANEVHLVEAHDSLGGRARSTTGRYVANEGPHAFYSDGAAYEWLAERELVQPVARPTPHWSDRPAVQQRAGVWLVGDSVAAPGLLSEVAVNSALEAARSATAVSVA